MQASGENDIILFNDFNKFSNKITRILHSIYHIPKKRLFKGK
jgi:hypothetical protein